MEDNRSKTLFKYTKSDLDRARSCEPKQSQLELSPRRLLVSCSISPKCLKRFRAVNLDSKYIVRGLHGALSKDSRKTT